MARVHILLGLILITELVSSESSFAADKDAKALPAPNVKLSSTYGSHLVPILQAIDATPDQRKQITDVVEEFRPKIQPMKSKYKEVQSEFLSAMMSGRAPEELMNKQEEMNELYSRIVNEYCLMNLRVRKLLNPSQFQKYEQYRKKQGWTDKPKS